MSAELSVYQSGQPLSPVDYQDRAVQRLAEWAHAADAAHAVASKLVQSSFVPAAFRGKAVEATAAILAGAEVGLSPMSSLRAFDVIQGQAAPRAITLRAIAQSYGHDMVLVESTATRCKMKGRRKGATEWQDVTWTMDRARDLGLTSKDGWKKQPIAMLLARATSELARLIAADAILGIGYSAEEVADGTIEADAPTVTAEPEATPGRRRMSRPKPTPEPEPVEDEGIPDDEGDDEPLITPPQMKMMQALFHECGITTREDKLAFVAEQGIEVDSATKLSIDQASVVIDALQAKAESGV